MNAECFEKNLELFSYKNPRAALALEGIVAKDLLLTSTWAGEPTLFHKSKKFFYHSKQNAAWEAKQWFQELHLEGIEAILVIGTGLGYYYYAVEEWLKMDPARFILFLEDDLQVMKLFLGTEKATALLTQPQVIIKCFETPGDNGWGKFREEFTWIFWAFATAPCLISALKGYAENRQPFCAQVSTQLQINLASKKEFLSYFKKESQEEVFTNFYHNTPYLFQAGLAHTLYAQFRDIPAIICGAGPSLAKHFTLLQKLQDKAVIFGAGSALNALTAHGVIPHFAAGVDPTEIQENRLRAGQAFGVPFFYRMRFHAGALQEIHGPKLYVESGHDPYATDWFERQWGLYSPKQIEAGTSTTHFCLKIAEALGCNPIILTGMDLAYTGGKRYTTGIEAHPTSSIKERNQIGQIKNAQTICVKGIAEPKVLTTWSWIQEGALYTQFLLDHPEITLINATEGGMAIWQIPQENLAEVSRKYLQHEVNLPGRIQTLILEGYKQSPTSTKILSSLNEWLENLGECEKKCHKILNLLSEKRDEVLFPKSENLPHKTGILNLYQAELESELIYLEFFNKFNAIFNFLSLRESYLAQACSENDTIKVKHLKQIEIECKRYSYLLSHLEMHRKACHEGIENFLNRQSQLLEHFDTPPTLKETGEYWIKDGILHLEDKSLELSVHEPFEAEEKITITEHFKEVSFYQGGVLHGPSRFYTLTGVLRSETWYVKGVKQGKQQAFFTADIPWRRLHYKNDRLHGPQIDYYPNSLIKSEVFYQNGLLEGLALFYFSNGRMKRSVSYKQGKRHGYERYWNESGNLIVEAQYERGTPCGLSRKWHSNGQLARQVAFDENGLVGSLEEWDTQGRMTSLPGGQKAC